MAVAKLGDHFSLLGLPCGMVLSYQVLEESFLEKQREFHPDRYHDSFERQIAEAMSSRLNEAYRVLKDPIRRAEYLLQLLGVSYVADTALAVQAFNRRESFQRMTHAEREEFIAKLRSENNELKISLEQESAVENLGEILQRMQYNLAFLHEIDSDSDGNV